MRLIVNTFIDFIDKFQFYWLIWSFVMNLLDLSDTKENAMKKLRLLSMLSRSRAKRILNQWLHPISFMLRAREHSSNILSGEECQSRRRTIQHRYHHNGKMKTFTFSSKVLNNYIRDWIIIYYYFFAPRRIICISISRPTITFGHIFGFTHC